MHVSLLKQVLYSVNYIQLYSGPSGLMLGRKQKVGEGCVVRPPTGSSSDSEHGTGDVVKKQKNGESDTDSSDGEFFIIRFAGNFNAIAQLLLYRKKC